VPGLCIALPPFNDVIPCEAVVRLLLVLDLRLACEDPGYHASLSPIELPAQGERGDAACA
jgi:hypothetical protein